MKARTEGLGSDDKGALGCSAEKSSLKRTTVVVGFVVLVSLLPWVTTFHGWYWSGFTLPPTESAISQEFTCCSIAIRVFFPPPNFVMLKIWWILPKKIAKLVEFFRRTKNSQFFWNWKNDQSCQKRKKIIAIWIKRLKSRSTHTQFVGLYQCLPHSKLCAKYLPILNNRHKNLGY